MEQEPQLSLRRAAAGGTGQGQMSSLIQETEVNLYMTIYGYMVYGNGAGASVELPKGSNWGNREGTEEDKELLSDLIRDELRDTGNQGKSLSAYLCLIGL